MKRKPLHIANASGVHVVATDSTIWKLDEVSQTWKQLPDLPDKPSTTRTSDKGDDTYITDFEKFWEAYPKKVAKTNAANAFRKHKDKMPAIDSLVEIVKAHCQRTEWVKDGGKYIPHPATWLNGGQWEDRLETNIEKPKKDYKWIGE